MIWQAIRGNQAQRRAKSIGCFRPREAVIIDKFPDNVRLGAGIGSIAAGDKESLPTVVQFAQKLTCNVGCGGGAISLLESQGIPDQEHPPPRGKRFDGGGAEIETDSGDEPDPGEVNVGFAGGLELNELEIIGIREAGRDFRRRGLGRVV